MQLLKLWSSNPRNQPFFTGSICLPKIYINKLNGINSKVELTALLLLCTCSLQEETTKHYCIMCNANGCTN